MGLVEASIGCLYLIYKHNVRFHVVFQQIRPIIIGILPCTFSLGCMTLLPAVSWTVCESVQAITFEPLQLGTSLPSAYADR